MVIIMKNKMLFLGILISLLSCSTKKDFDSVVADKYQKCENSNDCIIDFSTIMWFEWDTMCFYSGSNSLEDINKDLGFELKEFTDIGDRLIFLNNGKVVYQKEWFPEPSEPTEGSVFVTDLKKMKLSKSDTKFKIKKESRAFYLEKY
jgi:hypothetical protein